MFVVVSLAALIALAMNPWKVAADKYDDVRENDVRDIMEVILEMQSTDPEGFAQIIGPSAAGRVMIGTADDCTGSYGPRCDDDLLSNFCIDLAEFAVPDYIMTVPVDPHGDFSKEKTGYYIAFEANQLEVGACNPESRLEILLKKDY